MITQEQIRSIAAHHDGFDAGCVCAGCKLGHRSEQLFKEAERLYKESQTMFKLGLDLRNKFKV